MDLLVSGHDPVPPDAAKLAWAVGHVVERIRVPMTHTVIIEGSDADEKIRVTFAPYAPGSAVLPTESR